MVKCFEVDDNIFMDFEDMIFAFVFAWKGLGFGERRKASSTAINGAPEGFDFKMNSLDMALQV
jgi:hypothetical protein